MGSTCCRPSRARVPSGRSLTARALSDKQVIPRAVHSVVQRRQYVLSAAASRPQSWHHPNLSLHSRTHACSNSCDGASTWLSPAHAHSLARPQLAIRYLMCWRTRTCDCSSGDDFILVRRRLGMGVGGGGATAGGPARTATFTTMRCCCRRCSPCCPSCKATEQRHRASGVWVKVYGTNCRRRPLRHWRPGPWRACSPRLTWPPCCSIISSLPSASCADCQAFGGGAVRPGAGGWAGPHKGDAARRLAAAAQADGGA